MLSDLVTVAEFRRMMADGYRERRRAEDESWERANEAADDNDPVGATWRDAQAFCAWKTRELGVPVRLPFQHELKQVRPLHSPHYERLCTMDFPWEKFPPRPIDHGAAPFTPPTAVHWGEPRFLEPSADVPEFPPPSGLLSGASRRRWISDFPPTARWVNGTTQRYAGLTFIDAWDAMEWCDDIGIACGRFWEGPLGIGTWGAYKNVKVGFRLALGEPSPLPSPVDTRRGAR